jgi:tripartite-type tricarboxylate transporter receptor subunit TctC
LVKYAKANPGKLSYGSTGNGSVTHLQMELLKSMTGMDIVHVPYRGSSPALTDLLGGNIQLMFDSLITSGPYLQNGQLRALAIAMNERSTVTPDVPTMAEAGVPGYDASAWTGLLGPPRLPKPVVERIHREVMTALQNDGVQRRVQSIGGRITGGSTDAYAKRIASEFTRWELLVKERNLKTD